MIALLAFVPFGFLALALEQGWAVGAGLIVVAVLQVVWETQRKERQ